MLQIDHIYEFLYQELFKDSDLYYFQTGVPNVVNPSSADIHIFTNSILTTKKIFFYDQEPLISQVSDPYFEIFDFPNQYTNEEIEQLNESDSLPYGFKQIPREWVESIARNHQARYKKMLLATSEISPQVDQYCEKYNLSLLYYFFHGFASLDWYRGYYSLNYSKPVIKNYSHDFISYNRIINQDRSYRIYWVSKLVELGLLDSGLVSFNVVDHSFDTWQDEVSDPLTKLSEHARLHAERHLTGITKLVIDNPALPGSASADIPRNKLWIQPHNQPLDVDALWHVVTETVFYYDKLHLTEKIFKPIVSKQPFMLLAAPGNLEYLRSYGFKTFNGIIDESYDSIQDNDQRVDAVAAQLQWYCNLSQEEKSRVIERLAPIVDYNFHHFYGAFRHIITKELLNNCRTLFKEIGYDDKTIAYNDIYRVLTN